MQKIFGRCRVQGLLKSLSLLGIPWLTLSAVPTWEMEALSKPPQTWECTDVPSTDPKIKAIYYAGLPFRGKETRVFAWYGVPVGGASGKLPAIVLVHGGGGSAFIEWVKLWNSRGYIAIAMDLNGNLPIGKDGGPWPRSPMGGPPGIAGDGADPFGQIDLPIKEQWPYHAVADVILAHSLLRSFPEVDENRIGITGISWGGYLTCLISAIDDRFKFAAPVYGCGHLHENSGWLANFAALGEEKTKKWVETWDPSSYVIHARMPILWVTGANDPCYPMDSLHKTFKDAAGVKSLSIKVGMQHYHCFDSEEIKVLADSYVKEGALLATITQEGKEEDKVWAEYISAKPLKKAELIFTKNPPAPKTPWANVLWETVHAEIDVDKKRVSAKLPEGAKVYYFNITDSRQCIISGEYVEVP